MAALEVLFTDDAVSPDGFSQTAYIILHANVGFFPFWRACASSNLLLYVISLPLCDLYFSSSVFYLPLSSLLTYALLCYCYVIFSLSVYHCASSVLHSNGKITNPRIVTSNSFFFCHSPRLTVPGLLLHNCISALRPVALLVSGVVMQSAEHTGLCCL